MITRYFSHADFDAVLHRPNPRNISALDLLLRVHLNARAPANPTAKEDSVVVFGQRYKFRRWTTAEWNVFQSEFQRSVSLHFNFPTMGLWLLPTPMDRFPDWQNELSEFKHSQPISSRFQPVVQCGLSVTLVAKKSQSHVSFDVLRLVGDTSSFRSFVSMRRNRQDTGMLTHDDITVPAPGAKKQNVAAHEIGHALGLEHSNHKDPACKANPNHNVCYGRPGTAERRNLMGGGNDITAANALPWVRAIMKLTPSLAWYPTDQMPKETHMLI